jgi:hypothetical protein
VARSRREAKDQVIAAVLAAGQSQARAAEAAGVTERTVQRRMADPAFRARVDDARGDLLGRTLDVLGAGALEAAVVLRQVVMDGNEASTVRVSASRALLTGLLQWRDQIELAQRIEMLERQVASRGPIGVVS